VRPGLGLAARQALHRALEQRRLGRRRQALEVVGDKLHDGGRRRRVALGEAELGGGPCPKVGDVASVGTRRRRRRPFDEDRADLLGGRRGEQDRRRRRAFAVAERLRPAHDRPSATLRSTFIAARLLEALGHSKHAETLFDSVVADDLEQGFLKDAVLDIAYVVGFHLRLGSPERAAERGERALKELERHDSAATEQLRSVVTQLVEAARGEGLDERMLRAAREFLRVHWKHAAPAGPLLGSAGERVAVPQSSPALTADPVLVEPLLARALLTGLRHEKRREQHMRRAISLETLAEVRQFLKAHWKTPAAKPPRFPFR
jgi:hypothetical protein